ncbi:unnamed protein product [Lampetra fluviatilis]
MPSGSAFLPEARIPPLGSARRQRKRDWSPQAQTSLFAFPVRPSPRHERAPLPHGIARRGHIWTPPLDKSTLWMCATRRVKKEPRPPLTIADEVAAKGWNASERTCTEEMER